MEVRVSDDNVCACGRDAGAEVPGACVSRARPLNLNKVLWRIVAEHQDDGARPWKKDMVCNADGTVALEPCSSPMR